MSASEKNQICCLEDDMDSMKENLEASVSAFVDDYAKAFGARQDLLTRVDLEFADCVPAPGAISSNMICV